MLDRTQFLLDYRYIDNREGGRSCAAPSGSASSVRCSASCWADVVALLIPILNTVQTVGTVQSSDIFAGDPYLHRMHQELGVTDVFVVPMAHPTTAPRSASR